MSRKLLSRFPLPVLPNDSSQYERDLQLSLTRFMREVSQQVNLLSDGRIVARQSDSATPASTVISYAKGDFVWNNNPLEVTATASSYVVLGWVNVSAGSPGTWHEVRARTGD